MQDLDPIETQEWLDALESVLDKEGEDRAHYLSLIHISGAHET